MKKLLYLFAIVCLMAGFSSCNKDKMVNIEYGVNVEIDPSSVMENFTEYYVGDFDLAEGDVLRIQLFVYNENGDLVENCSKECSGYTEKANFSLKLAQGNYTFIASSDIYTPEEDFEVWIYSGTDRINTFEISYCNYIRYDDAVLGLRMLKQEIKASESINISLKPSVALLEFHWNSVHYFSDVLLYDFCVGNIPQIVKVEGDGFNYTGSSGNTYRVSVIEPSIFQTNGVYGFTAILPVKNVNYFVRGFIDDTQYVPFGEGTADFLIGEQYKINVDIPNLDVTVNQMSKSVDNINKEDVQSAKVMDLIKSNPSLIQSEVK